MANHRIAWLDGLRGVLALMVCAHHFLYAFYPELIFGGSYKDFNTGTISPIKLIAFSPLNIIYNPGTAIHFFFLLSGYVQSYRYFQNGNTVSIQLAFFKRYFRLALPVLFTVLLIFLFHKNYWIAKNAFPDNPLTDKWVQSVMPDNLQFWQVIRHGLFDCFNTTSRYYQVLWTMPTELFNSWLVMILIFVTHQSKNQWRLLLFWLAVQLFLLQSWYGAAFTVGVLLAALQRDSEKFNQVSEHRVFRGLCLLAGLYFASYPFTGYVGAVKNSIYRPISFFETYPHIISYLIGVSLLFLFMLRAHTLNKILSSKPLLWLGNISFMLYLLHFLILFSFSPWLYQLLKKEMNLELSLSLTAALSLLASLVFSWLSTALVDRPSIRFSHYIARRLTGL